MKFKNVVIASLVALVVSQAAAAPAQCCGRGFICRLFGARAAYSPTRQNTIFAGPRKSMTKRFYVNIEGPGACTSDAPCYGGSCPLVETQTSLPCYSVETTTETIQPAPCEPVTTCETSTPAPCYSVETTSETSTPAPCEPVTTCETSTHAPCYSVETTSETIPPTPCEPVTTCEASTPAPCYSVETTSETIPPTPCEPVTTCETSCGSQQTAYKISIRPRRSVSDIAGEARKALAQRVAERVEIIRANSIRRRYGAGPLTYDAALSQAAQIHAQNMTNRGRIYHAPGCGWEIVAMNHGAGMVGALDQWTRSPAHFRILVNPRLTRVGVGFVRDRYGRDFCAMRFR